MGTKQEALEKELRRKLSDGTWNPGDKIPSESSLMKEYNVSRTLVRNVIAKFTYEGLIQSIQGKGSFVQQRKIQAVAPYRNFISEQIEQQGYVVDYVVIGLSIVPASPKLADTLRLNYNDPIYRHIHLRIVDGSAFSISESYFSARLFPDLEKKDYMHAKLSTLLEDYNYRAVSASETLEICFASSAVAEQLDVEKGFPLLCLEQLNYDANGNPYELNKILFRGDRIQLKFEYNR